MSYGSFMQTGSKIPLVAVGYTGYTTIVGLEERLNTTSIEERPDGLLVIDTGLFTGFGTTATGAWALYALAVSVDRELNRLHMVQPNLIGYAI